LLVRPQLSRSAGAFGVRLSTDDSIINQRN
jgi:hypothetical protein